MYELSRYSESAPSLENALGTPAAKLAARKVDAIDIFTDPKECASDAEDPRRVRRSLAAQRSKATKKVASYEATTHLKKRHPLASRKRCRHRFKQLCLGRGLAANEALGNDASPEHARTNQAWRVCVRLLE